MDHLHGALNQRSCDLGSPNESELEAFGITDAAQTYLKFVATAKHEGRPTDATRLANRG
jgi:hypothetical protein